MFEENLQNSLFNRNPEKSFLDKLFSRQDVERVKELVKKHPLTRAELLELLYMLTSNEMKLLNLSEWDRYIILKYFVWIREFVKIAELLYDYNDDLNAKEKKGKFVISERTHKLLSNNDRLIEHNAKFLVDLYFNIGRTSLSVGGTGFLESLKQKFEMSYPNGIPQLNTPMQDNRTGGIFRKK